MEDKIRFRESVLERNALLGDDGDLLAVSKEPLSSADRELLFRTKTVQDPSDKSIGRQNKSQLDRVEHSLHSRKLAALRKRTRYRNAPPNVLVQILVLFVQALLELASSGAIYLFWWLLPLVLALFGLCSLASALDSESIGPGAIRDMQAANFLLSFGCFYLGSTVNINWFSSKKPKLLFRRRNGTANAFSIVASEQASTLVFLLLPFSLIAVVALFGSKVYYPGAAANYFLLYFFLCYASAFGGASMGLLFALACDGRRSGLVWFNLTLPFFFHLSGFFGSSGPGRGFFEIASHLSPLRYSFRAVTLLLLVLADDSPPNCQFVWFSDLCQNQTGDDDLLGLVYKEVVGTFACIFGVSILCVVLLSALYRENRIEVENWENQPENSHFETGAITTDANQPNGFFDDVQSLAVNNFGICKKNSRKNVKSN